MTRSQARRLLEGLDRFESIVFDFFGVEEVGQAFADEVFRVFKNRHPELQILSFNENEQVRQMISRAQSTI
jgi:hypothetical protein